jgi:hypothetical protein
VAWHGRDGRIEADFIVSPRANPRRIRLQVDGTAPAVGPGGDLTAGSLHLLKPRAYQGGNEVACPYVVHRRWIRFELGKYDHKQVLTIDPILSFSTFFGGSNDDGIGHLALDSAGNIVVAGATTSSNFPISAGGLQKTPAEGFCGLETPAPCPNVFVAKLTGDGSTLVFSTYLGGSGNNSVAGIALDKAGNVYLTGTPGGSDFPSLTPLPGNSLQPLGPYVAKLASDGSSLLYSTMLPLSSPGYSISGLAADSEGAVYLAGSSTGGLPVVNAHADSFHP